MKKEQIQDLFERFENARYLLEGVECWSARELQAIFNYTQWRNFTKVIDKAKETCKNAGIPVSDHFADVSKMVDLAKGAQRQVTAALNRKRRRLSINQKRKRSSSQKTPTQTMKELPP